MTRHHQNQQKSHHIKFRFGDGWNDVGMVCAQEDSTHTPKTQKKSLL